MRLNPPSDFVTWLDHPGKPDGFHYLSHQTVDAENGIIVDVEVTAGNVSDNMPYVEQMDRSKKTLQTFNIEVEDGCADSSYDTALIHAEMEKRGITFVAPARTSGAKTKVEYTQEKFTYSQETDSFMCPNGKLLTLRNLEHSETGGFRLYQTTSKDCKDCPHREKCLAQSQKTRRIRINILQHIVDKHHADDGSKAYNEALNKRQIWCEGTFAAQKARHNLGQMARRGLTAAKDHCLLSACAINLKRLIKGLQGTGARA